MEEIHMSKNDMNRKDKMINSFLDTNAALMTKWGNEVIETNVPPALDWIINKFSEAIKSLVEKEPEQQEIVLPSLNTFLKGIECGERREEMAIIYGMKKVGLDEEKIQQILEHAQKAWEPKEPEDVDISPVVNVLK